MRTLSAFALLAFLLAPAAHAQAPALSPGSMLIDGSASFSSSSAGNGRQTSLRLFPSVQYFVSGGLALGGSVNLSLGHNGGITSFDVGVGPAATYFFVREGRTLQPFVSGSAQVSRGGFGDDLTYTSTGWLASAGALALLTESVGLTGRLYYARARTSGDFDSSFNDFGFALGLSAFVF